MAWCEFRRGKRNRRDVQQFEFNLEDNLWQLWQELKNRTYRSSPYISFFVSDPKLRRISKAAVRDRVLHQAIFRILYDVFDKNFIYDSYASRFSKGIHLAVSRLERFLSSVSRNNRYPVFALQCDIKKFFDLIDHNILYGLISQKITDTDCLRLIKIIITSFEKSPGKGLPLGNVTSQLFANVYLNELDGFIKHKLKCRCYLRYCDDFIILSKDRHRLEALIDDTNRFIKTNLQLEIHPGKISIRSYLSGIDFLGYVLRPHYRVLRTRTKRRMLRLIGKNNHVSYMGLLQHCCGYKLKRKAMLKLSYV
ncbi:MAG: reverse transcriptase domain-containing protein [bacterium]|nr:reverse transcriptase domain-containing protein [bacterium]